MDGPVVAASLPTAPDDGRHYVEAGLLTDLFSSNQNDGVLELMKSQHVVNTRVASSVRIERLPNTVWVNTPF